VRGETVKNKIADKSATRLVCAILFARALFACGLCNDRLAAYQLAFEPLLHQVR
jgi:hypothetical protein